jgi:hypothetical protein
MTTYNIISRTYESTVVAEYSPLLSGQGYECFAINNEAALIDNLRLQLETLNGKKRAIPLRMPGGEYVFSGRRGIQ